MSSNNDPVTRGEVANLLMALVIVMFLSMVLRSCGQATKRDVEKLEKRIERLEKR